MHNKRFKWGFWDVYIGATGPPKKWGCSAHDGAMRGLRTRVESGNLPPRCWCHVVFGFCALMDLSFHSPKILHQKEQQFEILCNLNLAMETIACLRGSRDYLVSFLYFSEKRTTYSRSECLWLSLSSRCRSSQAALCPQFTHLCRVWTLQCHCGCGLWGCPHCAVGTMEGHLLLGTQEAGSRAPAWPDSHWEVSWTAW